MYQNGNCCETQPWVQWRYICEDILPPLMSSLGNKQGGRAVRTFIWRPGCDGPWEETPSYCLPVSCMLYNNYKGLCVVRWKEAKGIITTTLKSLWLGVKSDATSSGEILASAVAIPFFLFLLPEADSIELRYQLDRLTTWTFLLLHLVSFSVICSTESLLCSYEDRASL